MSNATAQGLERPENALVAEMATVLRTQRINLEDERAVLVALQAARFRSGDVVALADRAIQQARRAEDPQWAKDQAWGGR